MEKENKLYSTKLYDIHPPENGFKNYFTRTSSEVSKARYKKAIAPFFSTDEVFLDENEYLALGKKRKFYERNFSVEEKLTKGYINLDSAKGNLSIDYKDKPSQIIKVKRLLKSEDINIGYTSKTELYLMDLLEKDASFTKEVVNHLYLEFFSEPIYLLYIIEIMSNLDYIKMQPNNITMALNTLNHKNIAVQEASVAAFEKWEDPNNIKYLRSMELPSDWMRAYTEEVIEYLEGC